MTKTSHGAKRHANKTDHSETRQTRHLGAVFRNSDNVARLLPSNSTTVLASVAATYAPQKPWFESSESAELAEKHQKDPQQCEGRPPSRPSSKCVSVDLCPRHLQCQKKAHIRLGSLRITSEHQISSATEVARKVSKGVAQQGSTNMNCFPLACLLTWMASVCEAQIMYSESIAGIMGFRWATRLLISDRDVRS